MLKRTRLILFKTKKLLSLFYVWWKSENLTSCLFLIVFWLPAVVLATRLLCYVTLMNFSTIILAIYTWYDMFKICSRLKEPTENTSVNKNSLISWKQSVNFESKNHHDSRSKLMQQIPQKSKSIIKTRGSTLIKTKKVFGTLYMFRQSFTTEDDGTKT